MAHRVCPVWMGHVLANPIRKLFQNPDKLLKPYVGKDMMAIDIGSAMGFFSIPLAKMTGDNGKVVCVDIQEAMLDKLYKRAQKAGVAHIIEKRVAGGQSLNIRDFENRADFALAFYVAHEVPDPKAFLEEVHASLKDGGRFLLSEPAGHIREEEFQKSVDLATQTGFQVTETPKIMASYSVVLQKRA